MNKNPDKILAALKKEYRDPKAFLDFSNPMEILVATILSAQSTDKRVNIVTKDLFKKYRKANDYADANIKEFEQDIRSTGFYRAKTRSITGAAKKIITDFHGRVPDTMEDLLKLPGVGRKTANIVLLNGFGKVEGIAVDTHVRRITQLMGLTKNDDPIKIEQDLMKLFDKKDWGVVNHIFVAHGRKICIARRPKCFECPIQKYCGYGMKFIKK